MKQYTVYSMAGCAKCVSAINLLTARGESFEVKKVDEDMEAAAFIRSEGHRAMPAIYLNGVAVPGGYDGLKASLQT
jgi:glutaredoxin